MKKPLLTIGMIFTNEIRCLERCMKSLEPLRKAIPCELVMADTGSTDGSREIAEKYADLVFDFPWIDDFAAARNAVLERSSGKWFLTLDADEWLDANVDALVRDLKDPKMTCPRICIKIRNFSEPNKINERYNEFYAMRLIRTDTGVRYEGCIHEHWNCPQSVIDQGLWQTDGLIYHDGYAFVDDAAKRAKWARNMKLLRRKLAEDPDNLQTLSECMDSSEGVSEESIEYARHALEVLHRNWEENKYNGAKTYRDAISVARIYKLPELLEWAEKALELFPDSLLVRIDITYYAYARCWENDDMEGLLRWGALYREALADYRAGRFERIELVRGVLGYAAPYWERQLLVFQARAYIKLKRYDEAASVLEEVNGAELSEASWVETFVHSLLHLHQAADRDTEPLITRFWEQINQPSPSEDAVQMRRAAFLNAAAASLTPQWQKTESMQPEFKRYSYTALLPLEGKCICGDAAAILEILDPDELAKRIAAQKLTDLPISALAHALQCGMAFPLPGQDMKIEEMDALASRLDSFCNFLELSKSVQTENLQLLCWKRTLVLAGVRSCTWNDDGDMAIAEAFVEMERQFLPVCYAPSALTEEGMVLLPPLHRFGWYCVKAFDALEAGESAGYVRLLRQGLEACPERKPMVEFLLEQLEESRRSQAAPELLALAEQVRFTLSAFAPDDPTVLALKQSEAYRQVAHLIEGSDLGVFGGLPQ